MEKRRKNFLHQLYVFNAFEDALMPLDGIKKFRLYER